VEIPASMSFEQAVVLPVPLSLAAAGLYQRNHLNIPLPGTRENKSGQKVLVMDAASNVGAMAVQLAVASDLIVIATAARGDHAWVRSLGAAVVFDPSQMFAQDQLNEVVSDHSLVGIFDATTTDHVLCKLSIALANTEILPRLCAIWPTRGASKYVSASIGKYNITWKQEKIRTR
jgi:NADPH:quinone reductase-like Zn-dependent oxidoreductase